MFPLPHCLWQRGKCGMVGQMGIARCMQGVCRCMFGPQQPMQAAPLAWHGITRPPV